MRIIRTAWERRTVEYRFDLTEEYIKDLNKSIEEHNPDFIDLTNQDIIDAWCDNESPRAEEKIYWMGDRIWLFDYIIDYIKDYLWESPAFVLDAETVDWEDETYLDKNEE